MEQMSEKVTQENHYWDYIDNKLSGIVVGYDMPGNFWIFEEVSTGKEKVFFYKGSGFKINFCVRSADYKVLEKAIQKNEQNIQTLLFDELKNKTIKITMRMFK